MLQKTKYSTFTGSKNSHETCEWVEVAALFRWLRGIAGRVSKEERTQSLELHQSVGCFLPSDGRQYV